MLLTTGKADIILKEFQTLWKGVGLPREEYDRERKGMLTKQISNRLSITNSDPHLVVGVGFCLGFTLRSQGARLGWFS